MLPQLPPGYQVREGTSTDLKLLVHFLVRTYQEIFPHQADFTHLQTTAKKYFSQATPLWWVGQTGEKEPIATLWMGTGIDQVTGERYAHIFLLYVAPEHRRQGIARLLLQLAQNWAQARGDRQMALQVFLANAPALNLYQSWGFSSQSLLMLKKF